MRERGGMAERIQAAAVVVFVLLIAAVVVVLLTQNDRDSTRAAAPTRDSGDDSESASEDPVGPVSIRAGQGDLLVRVIGGSCTTAGGPKLELSKNQGRTFRRIRLPQVDDGSGIDASSPAVRAIVFAKATTPAKMTVAGADANCEVHRYTTTDAGATWSQHAGAGEEWYLDPSNGGVVSPARTTNTGCKTVAALAPESDTVATVFCAAGEIRTTNDGGGSWTDVGRLTDVTAAVFTGPRTGYAAVADPKCKSRIYATVSGGAAWVPQGCVAADLELPGLTANEKLLVAGGSGGVRLSTDDGSTWKVPDKF